MGRSQREERGFAAMDDEKQREIAPKGGEVVSEDREHLAGIGRKGGEARAEKDQDAGSNRGGDQSGPTGAKKVAGIAEATASGS